MGGGSWFMPRLGLGGKMFPRSRGTLWMSALGLAFIAAVICLSLSPSSHSHGRGNVRAPRSPPSLQKMQFVGSRAVPWPIDVRRARDDRPREPTRRPVYTFSTGAAGSSLARAATSLKSRVDVEVCKEELKAMLKKGASPNDKEVKETVAKLSEMWRSTLPPDIPLNRDAEGNFNVMSKPSFPGQLGEDDQGRVLVSLGRLSFNMFKPAKLKCAIKGVRNPIKPLPAYEAKQYPDGALHYAVIVDIEIETPEGKTMDAELTNEAVMWPSQEEGHELDRWDIVFTGGKLKPAPGTNFSIWKPIFEAAYARRKGIFDRLRAFIFRRLFGIEVPSRVQADGIIVYTMKRKPKGWLDLMFLDNQMRITKGNRGSIVITDRK